MVRRWVLPGAVALALAVAAALARAQAPPPADQPHPLRLAVGESIAICETGTVICPASVLCDDASIVSVGADARGALLSGRRPGSTLCSAGSASGQGMRRIYRVTVVERSSPR